MQWSKYLALWPSSKYLLPVCYMRLKWLPIFVSVCNSCCFILFQQHIQPGFIFAESFQAEKGSLGNLQWWHLFSVQFHLAASNFYHLICASPASQFASEKIVRLKGESFMGAKASKVRLFQERCAIARARAHTRAEVFRHMINCMHR